MKLTVSPDSAQCIFLKLLLWMNLLGAGSIIVLWALGLTGIESAQANPSDQQVADWQEPSANWSNPPDAETTTPVHTAEENLKGKESLRLSFANHQPISVAHNLSPSTPDPSAVAVALTATPHTARDSSPPTHLLTGEESITSPFSLKRESGEFEESYSTNIAANPTPSVRENSLPSTNQSSATDEEKLTTESESNPDLEQQTPKSDRNCTDDTVCSQVSSNKSEQSQTPANLTLAQLPSLPLPPLPVPSNPIPGGSSRSNSTVGQLPAFPFTSPSPGMVPMGVNGYNPTWGQSPAYPQTPNPAYIPATSLPVGANGYTNPTLGQYPAYPQTPTPVYIPATSMPVGASPYNPTWGQSPVYIPATSMPVGASPYNPGGGQLPYAPQMVIVVPMSAGGMPMGATNYNPNMGQLPYAPQMVIVVPMPAGGVPMGATNYNPGMGQYSYIPQPPQAWPVPPTQNQAPFNSYNPGMGQFTYAPQTQAPLPAPVNPNASGYNTYNP
ncbi:hypothetical protein IQ258_25035, partial [Coleofasciculus sp. LEGE 07081]|uniref:hypothetical protein n=1 Tax=Coleofasciculus sp. LEGE 07081 TaxID=2777967 RepID=UPI001882CF0F